MLKLSKLFGNNPFKLLETHMQIVVSCIEKLDELVKLLGKGSMESTQKIVDEISTIEFNADSLKFEIRKSLSRLFFPIIKKEDFLELLFLQDNLANRALECANLCTLQPLVIPEMLVKEWHRYVELSLHVFRDVANIVFELTNLIEASCGGAEMEKMKLMIERTAHKEYEADLQKVSLQKLLYQWGQKESDYTTFYQINTAIRIFGDIAHISEHLVFKIMLKLDLN